MSLLSIRKAERRDTWAAFSTLFLVLASHSMLETARDALFLTRVPAAHLPWVFLVLAFMSLGVVKLQAWLRQHVEPRRTLSCSTLIAGIVTFGFFALHRQLGAFGVYALYCWSGLLATALLTNFWVLIGGVFTITQAKRLYGIIGTGGVLGAIVGSGLAGLLSRVLPIERLLCFAGAGFLIAAAAPWSFKSDSFQNEMESESHRLRDAVRTILQAPYASRIAISLFLASACLTVADFVFKSSVAALVPKAELGTFLGSVYFTVNVLSLVCQLGLVGWVLKRASLGGALSILPLLLVGTGLGVAAFGGLASVLAVKAADGALRYSLHRTASELLFLPLADPVRRRVKAFVDVVGQRGGQVLGSLAILSFVAVAAPPRLIAVVLVVTASAWAMSAIALRRPYVELFRSRLDAARMGHLVEFPELDVGSLETLTAALESDNDMEVLAALKILDSEQKSRFIPTLILHHPSEQVVVRALSILTRSGRKNLEKVIARVVDHPSARVRAASIAAKSVLEPDDTELGARLDSESSQEVRNTILVNLVAGGRFSGEERVHHLRAILQHGSPAMKIAFCEAIELRHAEGFLDELVELTRAKESEVRSAALMAMNSGPSLTARGPSRAPVLKTLIHALGDEGTRPLAVRLLALRGESAFGELQALFEDGTSDKRLRARLPRAMGECSPADAVRALVAWLPHETDGSVRYPVIRELERLLRREPTLAVDQRVVSRVLEATVTRAFRYIDRRLTLLRGAAAVPGRKTQGHDLLVALLRDKQRNACGRLFRLLGVLHPREDFAQICRGLSGMPDVRATSLELIESVLREPLRGAVLALADEGDDELQLTRGARYHRPLGLEYEALLTELGGSRSEAVREVTRFHLAELGLDEASSGSWKAA